MENESQNDYMSHEDLIADIRKDEPDYMPDNVIEIKPSPTTETIDPLNFEYFKTDIPNPIEYIFYPCLPTQGIAWIYAPTGVGKTLFSMTLAYTIAQGGNFLKYSCAKPRRVLYVDGEMPYNQLHSRVMQIARNQGELDFPDNFKVLTPDKILPFRMPKIDDPYSQRLYIDILNKYDIEVIIFDNLSMLSTFDENKANEFKLIQDFLLTLRSIGKTVIVVHHSGKSGDYRGTSKMLDSADVVISLEPVVNDVIESNVNLYVKQFKVKYKKSRCFGGKDALSYDVFFDDGRWSHQSNEISIEDKIIECVNAKMSQREIARELLLNQTTVHRMIKRLRVKGRLSY